MKDKIKNLICLSDGIISERNFEFDANPRAWFGTGGKFSYVFKPKSEKELMFFLKNFDKNIKIFPVGMASNLLVHDHGFHSGVIVKFLKLNSIEFDEEKSEIRCGSGVFDKALAQFALENSIPNFEFLSTIPGNIGGALAMNAGCFGSEIKDILKYAFGINRNGEKIFLAKEDFKFSYRSSIIKDIFITEAVFEAKRSVDQMEIFNKMENFKNLRNNSQPTNSKTGGSTFKNPTNSDLKAWELIHEVGLRGFRIGGAHFSEKHSNFIINDQNATSSDIKNLIEEAQRRILEKFNIDLKAEIVFLGFDK